jgi:UDP-N-acetyl-D-glucosamine dehydrogenase
MIRREKVISTIEESKLLNLEQRLKRKTAIIGVVGLGYVGLPLAIAFAEAKFKVLGLDTQEDKVELVNKGRSYISDVCSKNLLDAIRNRRLRASTDQSRLKEVDAICICVPTPLTKRKDPELSYVISASEMVSKFLQHGQLVVLESTTYPGTTREIMLPILERSGLRAGRDFYLAFSPERVDPGSKNFNIKNTPKLVGGIDSKSTRIAQLLYSQVADEVVPVPSPEVAEMTKVFENVFRNVNIALVNELAMLCEKIGISVWQVIDAAATKPFGYMAFHPGPGVGGHCIPLDPYYLANKAREYDFHTRFIELAADINEHMPYYTVSRIIQALNDRGKSLKGAKVLLLGVTYKRDVADIRESPSLKLIGLLREKGANLRYNDPHIPNIRIADSVLTSVEITDEHLASADCVVIATDHTSYDYKHIADKATFVFDARGVTRNLRNENIIRL